MLHRRPGVICRICLTNGRGGDLCHAGAWDSGISAGWLGEAPWRKRVGRYLPWGRMPRPAERSRTYPEARRPSGFCSTPSTDIRSAEDTEIPSRSLHESRSCLEVASLRSSQARDATRRWGRSSTGSNERPRPIDQLTSTAWASVDADTVFGAQCPLARVNSNSAVITGGSALSRFNECASGSHAESENGARKPSVRDVVHGGPAGTYVWTSAVLKRKKRQGDIPQKREWQGPGMRLHLFLWRDPPHVHNAPLGDPRCVVEQGG